MEFPDLPILKGFHNKSGNMPSMQRPGAVNPRKVRISVSNLPQVSSMGKKSRALWSVLLLTSTESISIFVSMDTSSGYVYGGLESSDKLFAAWEYGAPDGFGLIYGTDSGILKPNTDYSVVITCGGKPELPRDLADPCSSIRNPNCFHVLFRTGSRGGGDVLGLMKFWIPNANLHSMWSLAHGVGAEIYAPADIPASEGFKAPSSESAEVQIQQTKTLGAFRDVSFPVLDLAERSTHPHLDRNGFEIVELVGQGASAYVAGLGARVQGRKFADANLVKMVGKTLEQVWLLRTGRHALALCPEFFNHRDTSIPNNTMAALPVAHINATDPLEYHVSSGSFDELKRSAQHIIPEALPMDVEQHVDVMLNAWLPLKESKFENQPLATMDSMTFDMERDTQLKHLQGKLISRVIEYKQTQKWYFDSSLTAGRLIVFTTTSHRIPGTDTIVKGAPHGAFSIGDGKAQDPAGARKSAEIRCTLLAMQYICQLVTAVPVPGAAETCQCSGRTGLQCPHGSPFNGKATFPAIEVLRDLHRQGCKCLA